MIKLYIWGFNIFIRGFKDNPFFKWLTYEQEVYYHNENGHYCKRYFVKDRNALFAGMKVRDIVSNRGEDDDVIKASFPTKSNLVMDHRPEKKGFWIYEVNKISGRNKGLKT